MWTEHLGRAGVDTTALAQRERLAVADKRSLPLHAWEAIYERFSSRHHFFYGRDQLGCDDEDDPIPGFRGIAVDVYNGITGLPLCSVDVGVDYV